MKFAVIGDPIAHSLSPLIHTTSFSALGIDANYEAIRVKTADLAPAMAQFREEGFTGVNVTMPLKRAVIDHLDSLSPLAERIGAVNTIEFTETGLVGHNTDGRGLWSAIEAAGGDVRTMSVVVIGAGGTGAAVVTQAVLDGARHIVHVNRTGPNLDRAREQANALANEFSTRIDVLELGEQRFFDAIAEAGIIIDSTSVGMGELAGETNVSSQLLDSHHIVADTVYYPRRTRLLEEAQNRGATIVDGLAMLVGQAAYAEEIWLGAEMPLDHVTRALEADNLR